MWKGCNQRDDGERNRQLRNPERSFSTFFNTFVNFVRGTFVRYSFALHLFGTFVLKRRVGSSTVLVLCVLAELVYRRASTAIIRMCKVYCRSEKGATKGYTRGRFREDEQDITERQQVHTKVSGVPNEAAPRGRRSDARGVEVVPAELQLSGRID